MSEVAMSEVAALSRRSTPESTPPSAGRILIIDDEAEIRESLETLLQLEGYTVVVRFVSRICWIQSRFPVAVFPLLGVQVVKTLHGGVRRHPLRIEVPVLGIELSDDRLNLVLCVAPHRHRGSQDEPGMFQHLFLRAVREKGAERKIINRDGEADRDQKDQVEHAHQPHDCAPVTAYPHFPMPLF